MGKYFITGRPGSGKSTVIRELQRRGLTAYDTDAITGVTKLQDKSTGEIIEWPDGPVDWNRYAWNWQEERIVELINSADTVFLGAIVGNQREFYHLFDKVFVVTIDEVALSRQLETHEHDRVPEEKARLTANHMAKQQLLIDEGGIPITNSGPIDEVADEILQLIEPNFSSRKTPPVKIHH